MWTIGIGHYLGLAAILFTLGIFGVFLNRKNVIVILMSVELMLLAVNINLVAFSVGGGDRPRDPRRLLPQPRLDRG
jgi:NADH-quinone oxidoreductase subunit K